MFPQCWDILTFCKQNINVFFNLTTMSCMVWAENLDHFFTELNALFSNPGFTLKYITNGITCHGELKTIKSGVLCIRN